MTSLKEKVYESYQNAIENGYDLSKLTYKEIAMDMLDCDSDIEGNLLEDVIDCLLSLKGEALIS